MTKPIAMRGAAPVGRIDNLAPVEVAAVLCIRMWHEGPDAQRQIRDDFAAFLGPEAGDYALTAIADFCGLCARHGRRTFMRHHPGCRCLGADEACLANLVAHAIEGERDDALPIATLLVRPDLSPLLVAAARTLGLTLRRLALKADGRAAAARTDIIH